MNGYIFEDNAQNVIFELSNDLDQIRIVRRDFADVFNDEEYRQNKLEHPLSTYHSLNAGYNDDIQRRRSFAFDFKLCGYVIEPLIRIISLSLDVPLCRLENEVRKLIKKTTVWSDGYFPTDGKAYGYENKASVGRSSYIEIERKFR